MLASCGHEDDVNPPFYKAGDVAVWPDSISFDSTMVRASEIPDSLPSEMPSYESDFPLGDALWRKAMENYSVTGTTPVGLWLFDAIIDPQGAMDALTVALDDGLMPAQSYPLVTPRFEWALAAWDLYCLTGDREWLEKLYNVVDASIDRMSDLSTGADGLIRGQAYYLSPADEFYPRSWQPIDRFTSKALGVNAACYGAMKVAEMAALKLDLQDSRKWNRRAHELAQKINDSFWQPALGAYGSVVYGEFFPVVCPSPDNYGNQLCSLLGIATPQMAERISTSRPVAPRGVPVMYPSPGEAVYPPMLQALQAITSSRVGSDGPFLAAMVGSWISQIEEDKCRVWPAVVVRGIFGIEVSPDGMSISPFVPKEVGGFHHISGLKYRGATLDITLHGTGNRIASVTLDGKALADALPVIPAEIAGHHDVEITMSNNTLPLRPVNVIEPPMMLPEVPKVRWKRNQTIQVAPQTDSVRSVIIDGVNLIHTSDATIDLTPLFDVVTKAPTHEVCVVANTATPGMYGFSAPAHIMGDADAVITIPATAITPRRPPRQINRPDLAAQFIELAARHNTRLTLYVNISVAGDYDISIVYSNGSMSTGLRTLSVNGTDVGTLICPPNDEPGWIQTQHSTSLRASLPEGRSQIALTYQRSSTILLNSVTLIRR